MCRSAGSWAVAESPYGGAQVWIASSQTLNCMACVLLFISAIAVPAGAQEDGIGAGLGFDVEYVAPQKFRDPGDRTRAWFPVKYVCGEAQPGDRLAQGVYTTDINVLNLSKFKVKVGWWFSGGAGATLNAPSSPQRAYITAGAVPARQSSRRIRRMLRRPPSGSKTRRSGNARQPCFGVGRLKSMGALRRRPRAGRARASPKLTILKISILGKKEPLSTLVSSPTDREVAKMAQFSGFLGGSL